MPGFVSSERDHRAEVQLKSRGDTLLDGLRKELGPGKVLCGLVKRIAKGIECVTVEDPASLEKAVLARVAA